MFCDSFLPKVLSARSAFGDQTASLNIYIHKAEIIHAVVSPNVLTLLGNAEKEREHYKGSPGAEGVEKCNLK